MSLLVTGAEIDGRRIDVRITDGRIADIAAAVRPSNSDEVLAANGGALLPGLHDHHLHLHAMAAAASSVPCGPPTTTDLAALERVLRAADARTATGEWIRGVGFHESVARSLDRYAIDRIVGSRPVRIQHRGGALWIVNSRGLRDLGLLDSAPADDLPGVERDNDGQPTGRLWRADAIFHRLRTAAFPDLAAVGDRLLRVGITGVTDATPDLATEAVDRLRQAQTSGRLPQRVTVLGAPDGQSDEQLQRGPRKLLLADHDLPPFDQVVDSIRQAHAASRAIAVHCVTGEALLLTLAALDAAGHYDGDRIEHAAVVPVEARAAMAANRIAVVTQPSFVADRGDTYLADVDPTEHALLYPYASLLAAGVAVAPSSDAPFGDADPWRTMVAAAERRTTDGAVIAADERVTAADVLAGYLSAADAPGGPARTITLGERADLCLLRLPLAAALRAPSRDNVRLVVAGAIVRRA